MATRFRRGATAYDKQGRAYVVEDVEDGIVYCTTESGGETEFPEAALTSEAEWRARSDRKSGQLYDRLRLSRVYMAPTGKLDRAASERVLAKVERLLPGILDFAAVTVARRIMTETGDYDLLDSLSVAKCREVFEQAKPETRASLLANILGSPPEVLVGAGRLGDNLMRAMLDKFLAANAGEFEGFGAKGRP
jgi:hypothetical protein